MTAPNPIMNAEQFARALGDLARNIAAGRLPNRPLVLIGVHTRGVPIARRLAVELAANHVVTAEVGAVDITLYRDDLSQIAHAPVLRGTDINFGVDDKEVVLVDDVLFTGRTVRAAMDAVCDLGRPAAIRLAVLVDRGHRELPIQADYCAARIETSLAEHIDVRLAETDGADAVWKESPSR